MKKFIPIIFIFCLFIFQGFKFYEAENLEIFTVNDCDSIPNLNKQILDYTKTTIGKKVATGECWDLAAEALNSVNAKWDGRYKFGKAVDPETECIYPGDVVQFEGVQVEYKNKERFFIESMPHHTAIIYKVNGKGNYELAHQNFGRGGRKVGITNLELKNITNGKIIIYRPVRE